MYVPTVYRIQPIPYYFPIPYSAVAYTVFSSTVFSQLFSMSMYVCFQLHVHTMLTPCMFLCSAIYFPCTYIQPHVYSPVYMVYLIPMTVIR